MIPEIYTMKLHDVLFLENTQVKIVRVAGGWVYIQTFSKSTTFVPYSDEIIISGDIPATVLVGNKK
jgi:hypothetical protein